MEYLLFAGYLLLFAWLVTKIKFFNRSGLSHPQLIIIFLLKVMAGIFYGWVGTYYAHLAKMQDTWTYHFIGLQESKLLFQNPHEYLVDIFHNPYKEGIGKFFVSNGSYWSDLKVNFFTKILSVFDLFSFGHYYTNVIFYSFITMFGPIAFYRVASDAFPPKKWQVFLGVFLIPSFIYWSSGLHKEGLLFLSFGLIVYHVYFALKKKKFTLAHLLFILLGLLLILILRNYLIVIIVPAVLIWVVASRFKQRPLTIFVIGYAVFLILFFSAKYIIPVFDLPQAVVDKQEEFLEMKGNSSVPIQKLEPTFLSFTKNFPQAISLSILRPYPSDVKHILSFASTAEVFIFLLLVILFLFRRIPGSNLSSPFFYFCMFFSLSGLLVIGYTVNNIGSIVRYRSVLLPFLFVPIISSINWKVFEVFFMKIKKRNNI